MNATWYTAWEEFVQDGNFTGWGTADVRAMLLHSEGTTPDDPDHVFVDDIVADETDDATYARQTVDNAAVAIDAANDRLEMTHDEIDYGAIVAASPYVGIVFYLHVTNDTDSRLICAFPLPNLSPTGTGFSLPAGTEGTIQFAIDS